MSRKKTHEEFMKDFEEKQPENFKNIEILGKYVNNRTKIKCRCLIDGREWEARPYDLLKGCGCPECKKERLSKLYAKTHDQFMKEMKEINPDIEILGEYVNNHTKIKCRCLIDGYEWDAKPNHLLQGKGCPMCAGNIKKTHEQFVEEMKEINPNIEIVSEYVNAYTKIKCRCLIDGYEWDATPDHLLRGRGCPVCGGKLKKTHEQFVEELKQVNPNIEVIGGYVNALTKVLCRCLIDGYEWEATPNSLLRGSSCPRCAHTGESWMDRTLYEILLEYDSDAIYRGKDTIGMELDSFCPNLNLAFEPGSWHWHQDKVERDVLKRKLCAEKGIRCITIYDSFPENIKVPFEEDCYVYSKDFGQNKEEFFEQMNKLIPKIIGGE